MENKKSQKMTLKKMEGSIAIIGDTGSGKTVFERYLIERTVRPMIIIDIKKTKHLNKYGIECNTVDELFTAWNKRKETRFLFRPNFDEKIKNLRDASREAIEEICWKFWKINTPMYIVIDELRAVVKSRADEPPGLYTWLYMGRERKKDLIFCIQRQQWVSVGFVAEARHIFHFQTNQKDIDLLNWLPYDITQIQNYQYVYYDVHNRVSKKLKPVPYQ